MPDEVTVYKLALTPELKDTEEFFELERICLSQDVMNHPEDIYLCQLPLCILPFDLGW